NNEIYTEKADRIIEEYMNPLLSDNIDVLVLGCTHYQFLKERIQNFAPNIQIIDPAVWAANDTYKDLLRMDMLTDSKQPHIVKFYISAESKPFRAMASNLLGIECDEPELVSIHKD